MNSFKRTVYNKRSHSSYLLQAHIIFVTKYRRRVLTGQILAKAEEIIRRECEKLKSQFVELNGEPDHVNMIISYHSSLSVLRLVQVLKSCTGRELKLHLPELNHASWRKNAL